MVSPGGQQILSYTGDVSTPEACTQIAERAMDAFGGLTILVNNAGILGELGRIEDVAWEDWAQVIAVNVFGPALLCRAVIPQMRHQGYGKIINVSGGGATKPLAGMSAYAASKAALVRLTENLALELSGAGVDVNAIAPGALNTRLLDEMLAAGPARLGDEFYEGALRQRETGGNSLEYAAALSVFLASAASDGISGRLISAVWDDWASLAGRRTELAAGDVYTLRRIVPADRGLSW